MMDSEHKSLFAQRFGDLLSTRKTQQFENFGFLHLHKCEDGNALGIFDRDNNEKHSHFVLIHSSQESLLDSSENDNNNNNNANVEPQRFAHSTPEEKSALNINEPCLGGSPLKMQVYADLSAFDSPSSAPTPIHSSSKCAKTRQKTGLPLRKGRALVSYYIACAKMATHKGETTLPPLWILCDAQDLRSTAVLGVEHLSSASKDSGSGHSFRTTMLSLQGRAVVDSQQCSLPWQSPGSTHAEAVYDVLESQVEDRVGYQGTLTLHLAWQGAFLLLQPPSLDAMATIRVATFPGDVRSPVFSLYQEMKMLQSLVTAMTTGELNWAEEEGEVPLLGSVQSLLDRLKTGHGSLTDPALDTSELATSPDLPDFKERLDFDFTDHIWKVFLKCSSFNEMTQCLRFIFTALIHGEVQPMVTRSNQTTMAQMVRETYQGRLSMPSLSGVFPLRLLAEVGMEKLKKDYAHAFISKGWSTMGLLENFLRGSQELQGQVEWLEKLHQALETVVMLQVFLKLPQATLGAVARHLLQHYKTATPVPGQVLELPVAATTVSGVFQRFPPCHWEVEVRREVGGVQEVSGLMLSTSQPFCHALSPSDEKCSQSDTTSNNSGPGDRTLYYTIKREEKVLM